MMSAQKTLLIDAVSSGQIDIVENLINTGYNINEQTDLGTTSVMIAVNRNDINMLKILINAGAKLDICNCFGDTALSLANKIVSSSVGYWKQEYGKIVTLLEETLNNKT
jgi:ankyrin repeat protein